MSILLEALKKSEQTRKLGETPTLATTVEDSSPTQDSASNLVPVVLIVFSALVMAWFGWQQFNRPEPVDITAEPAVVSTRELPAPEASDAVDARPRTPTENFRAPAEESPAEQSAGTDRTAEDGPGLQRSVESFVAEQDSEPEPATEEAPLVADAEDAVTRLRQDQDQDQDQGRDREPAEPSPDRGLKPHIAEPISYWELPQGVRDNLGEIRITVLVYADEPADRFLLANGQRLAEKDELDGGLKLDEIRRDGAVFTYRKYRFLVKG